MTVAVSFEKATRSLATDFNTGRAIPVSNPSVTIEPPSEAPRAILEFGGAGASIFQGFTGGIAGGKAVDSHFKEVSRATSRVRVENPDDPEQFVMVDRINSIQFQNKEGSVSQYDLNWNK